MRKSKFVLKEGLRTSKKKTIQNRNLISKPGRRGRSSI